MADLALEEDARGVCHHVAFRNLQRALDVGQAIFGWTVHGDALDVLFHRVPVGAEVEQGIVLGHRIEVGLHVPGQVAIDAHELVGVVEAGRPGQPRAGIVRSAKMQAGRDGARRPSEYPVTQLVNLDLMAVAVEREG